MPLGSPKNAATEEGNRFSLIRILCVLLWAGAGIALMLLNGKPFFNALIAIGCLVISAIAVGLSSKTINPLVAQKIGTMGLRARRFKVEQPVVALLPDVTQCEVDSHQTSIKIRPESTGSEAHRTTVKSTWIVLHLAVIAMLLSMLPSQWSHQQRIERQIQATIERHRAAGQE